MNIIVKSILLFGIVSVLNGCVSIINLACDKEIYGGVIGDYGFVKEGVNRISGKSEPTTKHTDYGMVLLGSIDMPFSFVIDTLSLVYTVPYQLSGGESHCSGMY